MGGDINIKRRTILVEKKDEKDSEDAVTPAVEKTDNIPVKSAVVKPTSATPTPSPAAAEPKPATTPPQTPATPTPTPAAEPTTSKIATVGPDNLPDLDALKKQYSIPLGKLKRSHGIVYWLILLLVFGAIGGVVVMAYFNPDLINILIPIS